MAVGSVAAGKAYVIISAMDKTRAGLEQAKANLNSFVKKYDAISTNLLSKGTQMASMGAGALTGPLAALNYFAEFDQAMMITKTKMSGTGEEYKELSKLAREYGRTTSWTAKEVADAMAKMASRGMKKQQIEDAVPNLLNFGRAGMSDLETASDVLLRTITAFGAPFSDATHYADVLSEAMKDSSLNMETLKYALRDTVPFANTVGMSIEQLSAGLMALSQGGFEATKAGMAMKNFLLRMAQKDDFLISYGIHLFDENGNYKNFDQIFADMQAAVQRIKKERGEKEAMIFAKTAFGSNATGGILSMLNSEGLGTFLAQVRGSQGSAAQQAQEMESGIWGSLQRIKSAWTELWLTFGEVFAPVAMSMEDVFVNVANWLSKITEANAKWIRLIAMAAGLLVGVGGILIAVGIGAKLVSLGFTMMALGAGLFAKTIAAVPVIMTKIVGLVGFLLSPLGLALIITGELLGLFTNFWEILGKTFSGFVELISQGRIQDAWELLILGMKALWLDFIHSVTGLFHEMISGIMGMMSKIGPLWKRVMGDVTFEEWRDAYDQEFDREGAENAKRIAELKAKVEAASAGELPADSPTPISEGALPEAQLGEMKTKRLAAAGALGQAIASAVMAGTSEFYQKFQENKANAAGQAALDTIAGNTGDIAEMMRSMQSQIEDLNDTVGM